MKGKAVFIVIAAVILIGVGVLVGVSVLGGANNPDAASPYSAVYLTTGDVYYGKFSWFPTPHMTDVWMLQRSTDKNGQPQLGVTPYKSVFWSPVDEVNFNPSEIVYWSSLKNSSQLVQAIENPSSVQQQPGQNGAPTGTTLPANTSSSVSANTPSTSGSGSSK